jgi:DNA-binding NarL/FixJ family response regulator
VLTHGPDDAPSGWHGDARLRSQWPSVSADVTPRQLAAIRAHLCTGTYKGAALRLGISPRTVRAHVARIRIRLNVETTEQAIYVLVASGQLIVPEFAA